MGNDNTSAAANMIAAGNSFWNNLARWQQNRRTQQLFEAQMPAMQAQADLEKQADLQKLGQLSLHRWQPDVQPPQTPPLSPPIGTDGQLDFTQPVPDLNPPDAGYNPDTSWADQTPAAQAAALDSVRKLPGGQYINPADVAMEMRRRQMAENPMGFLRSSGTIVTGGKLNPETGEYQYDLGINPAVLNGVQNPNGGPAGGSPNAPLIYDIHGQAHPNPAYITPEKQVDLKEAANAAQIAETGLNRINTIINGNPAQGVPANTDVYGPKSRGYMGGLPYVGGLMEGIKNIQYDIQAAKGNNRNITDSRTLQQGAVKGIIDTLSQVHIGRVTELEWGKLETRIPHPWDTQEVWNNFLKDFTSKVQETQKYIQQALQGGQVVRPDDYAGAPQMQLPNVTPAQVSAPQNTNQPMRRYTVQEAAQLPKGFGTFMGVDGQLYRK